MGGAQALINLRATEGGLNVIESRSLHSHTNSMCTAESLSLYNQSNSSGYGRCIHSWYVILVLLKLTHTRLQSILEFSLQDVTAWKLSTCFHLVACAFGWAQLCRAPKWIGICIFWQCLQLSLLTDALFLNLRNSIAVPAPLQAASSITDNLEALQNGHASCAQPHK